MCNTEARRRPYEDHHQLARSHAAAGRHHSRHRPNWLQRLPATPHKPAVHLRGRTASRRLRALTDDHSVQYEGALRPRIAPPEPSRSCSRPDLITQNRATFSRPLSAVSNDGRRLGLACGPPSRRAHRRQACADCVNLSARARSSGRGLIDASISFEARKGGLGPVFS